jgi:hypothetical protein
MLTTDTMSWDEVMHAPSPQPHAMDHELLKQAISQLAAQLLGGAISALNIGAVLWGPRALRKTKGEAARETWK